jgi:hypothetical protein
VVLATAIAESSLTLAGVRLVIDSGLSRLARFDPSTGMDGLVTVVASQASAEQRRGPFSSPAPRGTALDHDRHRLLARIGRQESKRHAQKTIRRHPVQALTHIAPALHEHGIRDRALLEIEHARRIIMWMQPTRPPTAARQQHQRQPSAVAPRFTGHEFRQRDRALPDTRQRIL